MVIAIVIASIVAIFLLLQWWGACYYRDKLKDMESGFEEDK